MVYGYYDLMCKFFYDFIMVYWENNDLVICIVCDLLDRVLL